MLTSLSCALDVTVLCVCPQALCRAEDEEDIVAASQAKAEQVAELAEFNENIPLDDGGEGRDPEEEELSKAEQEIAALVEQVRPDTGKIKNIYIFFYWYLQLSISLPPNKLVCSPSAHPYRALCHELPGSFTGGCV